MEINQGVFELDPTEYVSSLNGLTGDVVLAAGTNISLVPVGNTITINATDTDTGITQLTGDVTAGPGSGSQVATLATVNSNIGTFNNITINAKGLATAGSNVAYLTGNQTITLSGDISGSGATAITTTIGAGKVTNAMLVNSSLTIGSTNIALGATSTTLAGLTSVTSTTFVGALTGNASTATALATGRTISITGDLAYTSGSFDGTGNVTGTGTLASIIVAGGPTGSATVAPIITYDAKGRLTAVSSATITPAVGSITGLGTGVATALGVSVGSAGAFVTFNGALGTPSSGTGTNILGVPAGNLAGTTLASNVVTSSLTTLGTLTSLTINSATVTLSQDTNFVTSGGVNGMSIDGTTFSVDGTNDRVGIGTAAPNSKLHVTGSVTANQVVNITPTMTGNIAGTNVGLQVAPTMAVASSTAIAINAQLDQFGAGAGTIDLLSGLIATFRHYDTNTVTQGFGGRYSIQNKSTATITQGAAIYAANAVNDGGGTITTNYGVYIENQTSGATNYALYAAGGQSYFGGNVGIGAAPTNRLDVYGGAADSSVIRYHANGVTTGGGYFYSGTSEVAFWSGGAEKVTGNWTSRSTNGAGTANAAIMGVNGGSFEFYANTGLTNGNTFSPTLRFSVASTGVLALTAGIGFPATQVASSDPNTLDDYEEGTWTVTRNGFTEVIGGGSITNTGTYTKIGRMVFIHAKIVCAGGATIAAVAGNSYLSGLPFAPGDSAGNCANWVNASTETTSGRVNIRTLGMVVLEAWTAASNTWVFDGTYYV